MGFPVFLGRKQIAFLPKKAPLISTFVVPPGTAVERSGAMAPAIKVVRGGVVRVARTRRGKSLSRALRGGGTVSKKHVAPRDQTAPA